jgi:hypothetical protein
MADFRKFSEKYPFRQRSETPEIAIELSLQVTNNRLDSTSWIPNIFLIVTL